MAQFKKQRLGKEIDSLKEELALKENELKSYLGKNDDVKMEIKSKKGYKK